MSKGGIPPITVTYVANANPSIQVNPSNLHVNVARGTIVWNPTNCSFSPNTGVVFAPTTTTPAIWPYSQPAYNPATGNYSVSDPNNDSSITQYNYNISIKTNGGTKHTRFDPDITNTPP